MHRPDSVKPHRLVKAGQHAVQVACDVIACVVHMAGIQAYAHVIGKRHPVQDGPQLLKAAAHLAALARHGFQQHCGTHVLPQDGVEHGGDHFDARVNALAHMAAGVEVVQVAGEILHAAQVVLHGAGGKVADGRVGGAAVEGVGRVGQNHPDAVFGGKGMIGGHVLFIHRLGRAAPGIAGEELKGVGPDGHSLPSHMQIALGGG